MLMATRRMADILIVDDEEEIRAWLRVTLEEAGYVVREATDGNAALRMYDERAADLLILNLVMPNKDGIDTAIEIRRRNLNAKIIAMSGSAYNLKVARMLGANDIISKPFSEKALLSSQNNAGESVGLPSDFVELLKLAEPQLTAVE